MALLAILDIGNQLVHKIVTKDIENWAVGGCTIFRAFELAVNQTQPIVYVFLVLSSAELQPNDGKPMSASGRQQTSAAW